jgi:Mg/Co/Ni transporter MgtE
MQNNAERPLSQIAKTAAQYGLVIGVLLAIFSGVTKPLLFWEGVGMVLGGPLWAVVLTVPVVWIKRKLFKS